VVRATRDLLSGWSDLDRDQRIVRMRDWLRTSSSVYEIELPRLRVSPPREGTTPREESGFYMLHTNEIFMPEPSVVTLLHEFRHAMQNFGVTPRARRRMSYERAEDDARGWSLSLYYRVAPRTLKRLVADGRVFFMATTDFAEVDTAT
jgi:hypothetical protein